MAVDTAAKDRASTAALATFQCGRLRVSHGDSGLLRFVDRLRAAERTLPRQPFDKLRRPGRDVEFLRLGFLDAALPGALRPVADRPGDAADALFWQFPCRTEAAAWALLRELPAAVRSGSVIHTYMGLPWATWIDRTRRLGTAPPDALREQALQRVRIAGFRSALARFGVELHVHTVCQHVHWRDLVDVWRDVGISDVWLSHAPEHMSTNPVGTPRLHPWSLYAVNVEDPARRQALRIGTDPAARPLLASFIGAHAPHYLGTSRPALRALAGEAGFVIDVSERWHFEDTVYRHQVAGESPGEDSALVAAVARYNGTLSDSMFSLCPAGAGPNTLRLWESLAVGSVPVLLGPAPRMPSGGSLAPIDWEAIVLRVADDDITALPTRLRQMPIDEVRQRQQLGMLAYEQVRRQRCF